MQHDPSDSELEVKVKFYDDEKPEADWISSADVFAIQAYGGCSGCKGCKNDPDESDGEENFLFDLPTEEGAGDKVGLEEIEGGIGIDSCASDNVMAKRHLRGYRVQPSVGSMRGQRWGSASGHSIPNEGEVLYRLMTESG